MGLGAGVGSCSNLLGEDSGPLGEDSRAGMMAGKWLPDSGVVGGRGAASQWLAAVGVRYRHNTVCLGQAGFVITLHHKLSRNRTTRALSCAVSISHQLIHAVVGQCMCSDAVPVVWYANASAGRSAQDAGA
jgi:hypothetical protein